MKFRKILTVGIGEASLDAEYWKRMDALAASRVSLPKDSPDINRQLADADCLLINPFVFKADKGVIDAGPKLKYIGVLATGYGAVNHVYAATKGIAVCNIPGYSTESVAELTIAVILEYIRDVEHAKHMARAGDYSDVPRFPVYEIKGKKFGIIGLGRIGRRVAELAHAFGADVYYWSRNKKDIATAKYEEIDRLLSECDFVSLHLALNKDTENFLNDARIQKIKSGAVLLNLAPNELVDFKALEKRLAKGDTVYIFDHTDEMSPQLLKQLEKYKNCIMYPPIGYQTKEATVLKQEIFAGNMAAFLNGRPQNTVK
jgi:glycerate dehydrogenase